MEMRGEGGGAKNMLFAVGVVTLAQLKYLRGKEREDVSDDLLLC